MNSKPAPARPNPLMPRALSALAAFALVACAYVPRTETASSMSPHDARVFVTSTLLHNPVTNRPAHFDDYSGQILSVNIGGGRIRIVTANRTADFALTELQPSSSGPKVFLKPQLAVVTTSADAPRLADALFTLKRAAADGTMTMD